jgi:hypothetical protein
MVGWILFVFRIQEFINPTLVSSEYGHSSSKNRALQTGPKTSKRLSWFSLNFSNLWIPYYKIKQQRWYLNENNGLFTGGPNTKCQLSQNWLYQSDRFYCYVVFSN